MKFEYDLIYAPASAAIHVEWSQPQDTLLQRCREILHRGHWIPRGVGERSPHPVFASQGAHLVEKSFPVWSDALVGESATLSPAIDELDNAGEVLAKDFFGWPAAPNSTEAAEDQ